MDDLPLGRLAATAGLGKERLSIDAGLLEDTQAPPQAAARRRSGWH